MPTIRIAMVSFDWYPADPLVRRMSEAALDAGFEVDVFCLRTKGERPFEICSGVRTYRLPMDRGFGRPLLWTVLDWLWFMILSGFHLSRMHLKKRYDIVHVHNMPDFLIFASLIPKLLGAKTILEVQDVSPELMATKASRRARPLVTWLATIQEKVSVAYADYVITVGWPFEELLLKRGVPHKKLISILNSADPDLFPTDRRPPAIKKEPTEENPLILMYHGTLAERNGLELAIQAMAQALPRAPHLRLDLMGRGEMVEHLKEVAHVCGVSDRLKFIPICPSEEIVNFVVHGDVGIIPYRHNQFMDLILPTKAYEYAWMCQPIIASDTPAIRSMFRPESVAFCDPNQLDTFVEAIVDLYWHPEKRERMVKCALEDYAPFAWEKMATRYHQVVIDLKQSEQAQKALA